MSRSFLLLLTRLLLICSYSQFDALFALFRANNPLVLQNIDHLLNVFQHALASLSTGFYPESDDAQLTEETRNQLVELLKAINASQPDKIAAAGLQAFVQ